MTLAYEYALWADALYACDAEWWDHYIADVRARFRGALWTMQFGGHAAKYGLRSVPDEDAPELGRDKLHWGGNSGYQAVNLAYLMGYTEIVLLGYDMGLDPESGRRRADGLAYPGGNLSRDSNYDAFRTAFKRMNPGKYGLRVINCSRRTTLACFPRMSLESALSSAPVPVSTMNNCV